MFYSESGVRTVRETPRVRGRSYSVSPLGRAASREKVASCEVGDRILSTVCGYRVS